MIKLKSIKFLPFRDDPVGDSVDDDDVELPVPPASRWRQRDRWPWALLGVGELVFLLSFAVYMVVPFFPLPVWCLVLGTLLACAPFAWIRRCAPSKLCRRNALRVGAAVLALNGALVIVVAVAWWSPLGRAFSLASQLCVVGLGHVDTSSARLVVRCPRADRVRAHAWRAGARVNVSSDWAELKSAIGSSVALPLRSLEPDADFQYQLEFDNLVGGAPTSDSGSFRTAAPLGSSASRRFRFTFGSCLLPAAFESLSRIDEIRRQNSSFMLFLGDFVYLDQPHPELSQRRANVEVKYIEVLADKNVIESRRSMPWLVMYDDHEVHNNWDEPESTSLYQTAIHEVWFNWLGVGNPASPIAGEYFYSFRRGEACFFVLDTRRHRSAASVPADDPSKSMLGAAQLAALKTWLRESNSAAAQCVVKFVASSVPFTTLFPKQDSWHGFRSERQAIVDFIVAHDIAGVVMLSGDTHTAFAVETRLSANLTLYDFSASPIDGTWFPSSPLDDSRDAQTVLGKFAASDFWGTVDVDTSDADVGRVTVHFDAGLDKRVFSKTIEIAK